MRDSKPTQDDIDEVIAALLRVKATVKAYAPCIPDVQEILTGCVATLEGGQ